MPSTKFIDRWQPIKAKGLRSCQRTTFWRAVQLRPHDVSRQGFVFCLCSMYCLFDTHTLTIQTVMRRPGQKVQTMASIFDAFHSWWIRSNVSEIFTFPPWATMTSFRHRHLAHPSPNFYGDGDQIFRNVALFWTLRHVVSKKAMHQKYDNCIRSALAYLHSKSLPKLWNLVSTTLPSR